MVTEADRPTPPASRGVRWLALAIVLVDLFVGAIAWRILRSERAQEYERAGQSSADLAQVLAENLEGTITRIDLALLASADVLEAPGSLGRSGRPRTEELTGRIAARLPMLAAIRATDAEGVVVLGEGQNVAERVSVADLDWFIAARADPAEPMRISSPQVEPVDHKWSIVFSRPYRLPSGAFAGVVYATVRAETFTRTLAKVQAPNGGAIVLRGADNAAIARYPDVAHGASVIGQRRISRELEGVLATRLPEATFRVHSPIEHKEALASFRRVGGSPFYLLVTALPDTFLARWRAEAARTSIAVVAFILLSALAARLLLAALRSESETRFRALVVEAPIAVALTRGPRILYANRAFLETFGLPGEEGGGDRTLVDLVAPEEVARLTGHLDRRARGLAADPSLEVAALRADGTRFRAVLTDAVVALKGGPANVAFLQDVTGQRQAAAERERIVGQLQRALADVKTLSGLLPICAHCKKIRDDRGYWNRIETYLRERSDAEFTEGICPECAGKVAAGHGGSGGEGE